MGNFPTGLRALRSDVGRMRRIHRRRVSGPAELIETLSELLSNPDEAQKIGRAGRALLEDNRGALERLLVLLEPLLGDNEQEATGSLT